MKTRVIILTILVSISFATVAQDGNRHHGKKQHKQISELVDDLSAAQKRKVESITKESIERVSALRNQQKAIRDSINLYMERDGDQSTVLFPLFDREAALQAAISREMYTTKRDIDQVLSKEQRTALRDACKKDRKQRHKVKE